MRKALAAFLLCSLSMTAPALAEINVRQPKTLFEYAERSWAVGVIKLGKPLTFRDGGIHAFPSQINELVWAPANTKPRNLMFIYEVGKNEKDNPYFKQDDVFLAPIRLLPEHAYWKDNLPPTRRHEIYGGRRYAFKGDEIPAVKKILTEYLSAADKHGQEKGTVQVRAVVSALSSKIAIVREDAVGWIAAYPTLARDFEAADVAGVAAYLSGDDLPAQKATVIDALAAAKIMAIQPTLESLAKRSDETGAAARRGLERLGGTTGA